MKQILLAVIAIFFSHLSFAHENSPCRTNRVSEFNDATVVSCHSTASCVPRIEERLRKAVHYRGDVNAPNATKEDQELALARSVNEGIAAECYLEDLRAHSDDENYRKYRVHVRDVFNSAHKIGLQVNANWNEYWSRFEEEEINLRLDPDARTDSDGRSFLCEYRRGNRTQTCNKDSIYRNLGYPINFPCDCKDGNNTYDGRIVPDN